MKIETKSMLQRGTGHVVPPEPLAPPPVYQKKEVDLTKPDAFEVYLPYGRAYAKQHNCEVMAGNIQYAMTARAQGKRVLTLREADIAARSKLDLTLIFPVLVDATKMEMNMTDDVVVQDKVLTEDLVGLPDSIYELRKLWNRGVTWNRNERHKHSELVHAKADKTMARLRKIFEQCLLPPWPEEEVAGFHVELTKPEYMSFTQYEEARKRMTSYVKPEEK